MVFGSKDAAVIGVPWSVVRTHCHAPAASGASMAHWR
jgi:hypothetical protein